MTSLLTRPAAGYTVAQYATLQQVSAASVTRTCRRMCGGRRWRYLSRDQHNKEQRMDTLSAFAMGMTNKGNEPKVFDWVKAAKIISERKPSVARAGLSQDWENTGGDIWRDGKPVPSEETYTYLSSNWATPELDIDGEIMDCYVMRSQKPEWDSDTYWPKEAVAVLEARS